MEKIDEKTIDAVVKLLSDMQDQSIQIREKVRERLKVNEYDGADFIEFIECDTEVVMYDIIIEKVLNLK